MVVGFFGGVDKKYEEFDHYLYQKVSNKQMDSWVALYCILQANDKSKTFKNTYVSTLYTSISQKWKQKSSSHVDLIHEVIILIINKHHNYTCSFKQRGMS